jgi:multicomponent Na+:H+ antiporter subunit E
MRLFTFPFRFLGFLLFYCKEVLVANIKVAWDVVTPGYLSKPGFIALPLDTRTDAEILLLSNLISMTPGTLSMDVSTDRKVLYIHAMYLDDAGALKVTLKNDFERRVIDLMRP